MPKTARRQAGSGSIYQRSSDGMWIAYVTLPNDPVTGKRRRKVVSGKTRMKAKAKLDAEMLKLAQAGDLPTSSPTLERWLTTWLDRIARPRLKPRTIETYRGYVDRYIIPAIGRYRLDRLTPEHVRTLHESIIGRGLSSTTALQAHRILAKALTDAEREGKVSRNVATLLDAPRRDVKTRTAMTVEDAKSLLLHVAGDEYQAVRWGVALLAGLRQGESLGITRDMLDLDAGVLTVAWQLQRLAWEHGCPEESPCGRKRGGNCPMRRINIPSGQEAVHVHGGMWLTRPKSKAGWRQVPLVPQLAVMLSRYIDQHPPGMRGLIFTREDGKPIDPKDDSAMWHKALEDAGAPRVPLHSARHTTATLLEHLGMTEQMRVEIMGHSSAVVTRGYTHVSIRDKAAKMALLGDLLLPSTTLTIGD